MQKLFSTFVKYPYRGNVEAEVELLGLRKTSFCMGINYPCQNLMEKFLKNLLTLEKICTIQVKFLENNAKFTKIYKKWLFM